MRDASSGPERVQSSACTAEASGSMDPAGANVWVNTFAKLMGEKKPQDVWVLHPQDSLVAGHLDGGGFQYQLKGLSRLQCRCCPWTWDSAHVHILFHLWWDGDGSQGLVRMRVWGQRCQLCPPDTLRECQVSPANVRIFLSKLVLHILWKCYGDGCGPAQCPEVSFGDSCEACELGVCFLQKAPDPAQGPVGRSTNAVRGRHTRHGANGQQLVARGSGPMVRYPGAQDPKPLTIPLLVIDFIEAPPAGSTDFLSEGDCTVTIPFSLVDLDGSPGHATPVEGPLPAAGGSSGPPIIGQGSIYLSGSSVVVLEGKGIPVNVRAPIFHRQGLLPGSVQTFQLRGFLFQGRGPLPSPVGVARGQGPISFGKGGIIPGSNHAPVSYIIGLTANGEGSLTFPLSLTNIIRGRGKGGLVTAGDKPPLEAPAGGPVASEESSVTFPFVFTDDTSDPESFTDTAEGEEEDGTASASSISTLENKAAGPVAVSTGSIAIPCSVLRIIECNGPGYAAKAPQSNGCVTYNYYKRRRPRSRFVKSSCGSRRGEDSLHGRAPRRPRVEANEDFWIWVSLTICFFWLMCMYRLNLGGL